MHVNCSLLATAHDQANHDLQLKIQSNTGEKPYKCETYPQPIHQGGKSTSVHTGQKPYGTFTIEICQSGKSPSGFCNCLVISLSINGFSIRSILT